MASEAKIVPFPVFRPSRLRLGRIRTCRADKRRELLILVPLRGLFKDGEGIDAGGVGRLLIAWFGVLRQECTGASSAWRFAPGDGLHVGRFLAKLVA
jgi:hypothetical protein